jgi:hypothetical protein
MDFFSSASCSARARPQRGSLVPAKAAGLLSGEAGPTETIERLRPFLPHPLVSLMRLERCLGHRQTRHADRLASQEFQGADEILPFVSNLKSFGLILFGQQERGHGAV